jgi:hypothetical protein
LIQEIALLDIDAIDAPGYREAQGTAQQQRLNNFHQSG